MTRLFIAIDLSEEAISYLRQLELQLGMISGTAFKLVDDFHLTLLFLGEIPDDRIDEMKSELRHIRFDPFGLQLCSLGVFPSQAYISVVWVGIGENKGLMDLQKSIEEKMAFLRLKKDHDFSAHLTLARVKQLNPDERTKLLEFLKTPVKSIKFPVQSFKLYKSTLTPKGLIYDCIAEFS